MLYIWQICNGWQCSNHGLLPHGVTITFHSFIAASVLCVLWLQWGGPQPIIKWHHQNKRCTCLNRVWEFWVVIRSCSIRPWVTVVVFGQLEKQGTQTGWERERDWNGNNMSGLLYSLRFKPPNWGKRQRGTALICEAAITSGTDGAATNWKLIANMLIATAVGSTQHCCTFFEHVWYHAWARVCNSLVHVCYMSPYATRNCSMLMHDCTAVLCPMSILY